MILTPTRVLKSCQRSKGDMMKERDVWETGDNDFLVYMCMAGVGISVTTKDVWCGDDELIDCWMPSQRAFA